MVVHLSAVILGAFMGAEAFAWIALLWLAFLLRQKGMNVAGIPVELPRKNLMIIFITGIVISACAIIACFGLMGARFWYDLAWRAGNVLSVVLDCCFIGFFAWTSVVSVIGVSVTWKQSGPRISINIDRPLKVYVLVSTVFLASFGGMVGYALTHPANQLPCNFGANRGRGVGYSLAAGPHYNSSLDSLTGNGSLALQALETVLQAWSRFEQFGGFPKEVDANYSLYWYDHLHWCPQNPNEISLAEATQAVGKVYLDMYHLEPNPLYLAMARGAADAIVAAQDQLTGAWWERAMFTPQGTGMQPDPNNPYHQCYYADGYVLSIIQFLVQMFDEEIHEGNQTNARKYHDAIERCLENMRDNRVPGGSWNKRSLAIPGSYGFGSVLNDASTVNNIRALWLATTAFGESGEFAMPWAENLSLDVLDWLMSVQGRGGAPYQAGWADQYSEAVSQFPLIYGPSRYTGIGGYNQGWSIGNAPGFPAWGRAFEPPAMSVRSTMEVLDLLFDMWLATGNDTYLAPFPAAIAWFERDGMRASAVNPFDGAYYNNAWYLYYELGTNVPIMGLNDGGPFAATPYTYDLNAGRCCYGWFGFYVNSTVQKYEEAASLNFSRDAVRALWDSRQSDGPYSGDAAGLEQTAVQWVSALNADGYWAVNRTQYTIHDPAPYIVQVIRVVELVYGAGLLMQFLRSKL